jgi:outer membrane protein OmpA-like peptidoglycan-associated protein
MRVFIPSASLGTGGRATPQSVSYNLQSAILTWVSISLTTVVLTGCGVKVDPIVLESSLTNARDAIAAAQSLGAEESSGDSMQKAVQRLAEAEKAQRDGSGVQCLELAFHAEMEAKLAGAQARQQTAQRAIRAAEAEIIKAIVEEMTYKVEIAQTRQAVAEERVRRALAQAQRAELRTVQAKGDSEKANREAEKERLRAQIELAIAKAQLILDDAREAGATVYTPEEYRATENLISQARSLLAQDDFNRARSAAAEAEQRALQTRRLAIAGAREAANEAEWAKLQAYTDAKVAITRAQIELDKAEQVNAFIYAEEPFERAKAALAQANQALEAEGYEQAVNLAVQAESVAREAYAIAEVEDRKQREKALLEEQTARAKDVVFKAEEGLRVAGEIGLPQIDPASYEQARALLERARQSLDAENYAAAITAGEQSFAHLGAAAERVKRIKEAESQILNATKAIANTETTVTEKGALVRFSGDLFAPGRPEINPSYFPAIQTLAAVIKAYPDYKILIEGHSDSSGNADLNLKLTQERAEAFMKHLIEQGGVPANRLTAAGLGEAHPIADEASAQGRARNRRIDAIFLTREQ